jgi:replicative DNA helicase
VERSGVLNRPSDLAKQIIERVPPQALETEASVLGAMLLDAEAVGTAIEYLAPDCFYKPAHARVFESIVALYERQEPADLTTVAEALTKMGVLEKIGGRTFLAELAEQVATSAHIEYHCKILAGKAALRRLIHTGTEIVTHCYDDSAEVEELLDRAESQIFQISESRLKTDFASLGSILPDTFERLEEFHNTGSLISGMSTGYAELDKLTAGMHPGDLVVIAGRPSMGKTAFALNMAENMAVDKNLSIAFFSLEMSKEQLAERMLCGRARVNSNAIRTGRLPDHEWQGLGVAAGTLAEAKIFVDDSATLTVLEMRAKARRLRAQHKIDMVVVDYMQMMHSGGRVESRQQEISHISRSLKALAKELSVPVVALSQLSRQVEVRGGEKKPQLADLRESGAIEQDADVVMFVYRPAQALGVDRDREGNDISNLAEIIIAKQRNGPTGAIKLAFVREFARFENLAYIPQEDYS